MRPSKAPATPGARDELPSISLEVAAEAAVWMARLHGPDRSRSMERECLAWQARSAAHRLAFERCTDTWQEVAGVQVSRAHAAPGRGSRSGARYRGSGRRHVLAVAALSLLAASAVGLWPDDSYSTGVGEQRLIVLADGSRVTLNTSTTVRVKMTKGLRALTVERGEALFEVAKDPARPFVVSVCDAKVVATGTAFVVRATAPMERGEDVFGVTLIEGRVIVQPSGGVAQSALNRPIAMTPGARLRVGWAAGERGASASIGARLDRPPIESLLAWKRGFVVLDDVSLTAAVAEMNRYSRAQIVLGDSDALAAMRVSGAFSAGDNEAFARAVAKLYGLVVRAGDGMLELAAR